MANSFHIVVCASIVPDPLQTLEPADAPGATGNATLPAAGAWSPR